MSDLAAVAALGTTPIAGASPSGISARYEPEFEKLSAEIAKLESPEGRNSLKWDIVVDSAMSLLSQKTKDLLVVSYLTLGLLERDKYKGLAAGLGACRDMMTTFWETLFPDKGRLRARAQALQWMADRITPSLQAMPSASKSAGESLAACAKALEDVNQLAGERMGDDAPDLATLIRAVQEKVDSIPSDQPGASAPSDAPLTLDSSTGPSSSGGGSLPAIDSPEAARQAIRDLLAPLLQVSEVLRKAGPTDPVPFRLARAAVWCEFVRPPASKDGVTELAGGDAAFAEQQEGHLAKAEYAAVVEECETRFPSDPFWLDLHLFSCRALEGLGRPYAAAKKVIEDSVVGVVRSVPALLDLRFADSRPMAGEQTRIWILHELKALPSADESSRGGAGGESVLAEARKLAARKQFGDAIALIQKELKGLSHRRDRFMCRLNLAKLCQEAGKPELALPQLDGLDEEAKRFALDEWEPALAVELARLLWQCYKASTNPQKADEYYERLCRLDLSAALAANGKG